LEVLKHSEPEIYRSQRRRELPRVARNFSHVSRFRPCSRGRDDQLQALVPVPVQVFFQIDMAKPPATPVSKGVAQVSGQDNSSDLTGDLRQF
jgi:hypothetical protein